MTSPVIVRSPNLADGETPYVIRLYEKPRPLPFKNGGLARAAQGVRSAGRGGDDILLHINPQEYEFLKSQWGEPSYNPHTNLPEYGLFSKLKKALKFESFNVGKIVKGVLKNPQRLLTGAVDPLGTKITNKVFGTHYKPLVNQLGGATKDTFAEAKAKGMDTGLAKTLHGIAGAVAGFYGGNALGNLASTGLSQASSALNSAGSTAVGGATPAGSAAFQAATNAGKLAEAVPSVSKIGTASTGLGSVANAALQKGASSLADLGGKATDYAKDPKNWGTIAKGVGALGILGGASSPEAAAPPEAPDSPGLQQLPFDRTRTNPNQDWYTYGQGPEAAFYSNNTVPHFTPDTEEEVGHAKGGAISSRFVKGPGTGRSDSIDAKLSDGEYVLTAEDVALLGDGSSEAGAQRLDQFRQSLRKHKGGALSRGKISPNAKSPMAYLKGSR